MDPRFHEHLERELQFLREVLAEFAKQHRKVAGRLDLSEDPRHHSRDPYVNMLLHGVASLAARIHHKMDCEFPQFTQAMLETLYPGFLAPTPSMGIAGFRPLYGDPALAHGFTIPRHTLLRGQLGKEERTACIFRTAADLVLWPIELTDAGYFSARQLDEFGLPGTKGTRAVLKFTLEAKGGMKFRQIGREPRPGGAILDRLVFQIRDDGKGPERGPGRAACLILEQILSRVSTVLLRYRSGGELRTVEIPAHRIERVGFSPESSLLPEEGRTFSGFRLLREYFALPDRFLYFALSGLSEALRECDATKVDLLFLSTKEEPGLESGRSGDRGVVMVSRDRFHLYSVPVINLFEKEFDRVSVNHGSSEYPVIPDKTLPLHFEVYSALRVTGYGDGPEARREFRPFFGEDSISDRSPGSFILYREPRSLTESELQFGQVPAYLGCHAQISLVDPEVAPHSPDLRQIGIRGLCTNRHLPATLARGIGSTDFFPIDFSGPFADEIRFLVGPTQPGSLARFDASMWDLIRHLATNYLSFGEDGSRSAVQVMRRSLELHVDERRPSLKRQLEGLLSIDVQPTIRRVRTPGPMVFGRGVEIRVDFDEDTFGGSSPYLLGLILDEFFGRYVSINSFAVTVISTKQRGEFVRWPARSGDRMLV